MDPSKTARSGPTFHSRFDSVRPKMKATHSAKPPLTPEKAFSMMQTLGVCVFVAWAALFFLIPASLVLGENRLFLWGLPPGLAGAAFYLPLTAKLALRVNGAGFRGACVLAGGVFLSFIPAGFVMLEAINCFGDPGPAIPREAPILSKEMIRIKEIGWSCSLTIPDWREPRGSLRLHVGRKFYRQVEPGKDALAFESRPGLLGFEWIDRRTLRAVPGDPGEGDMEPKEH